MSSSRNNPPKRRLTELPAGRMWRRCRVGQFTDEQINAMSADEAREAIKIVALARVAAQGDPDLEARLKHEFNLLMDRLRREHQAESGSDR